MPFERFDIQYRNLAEEVMSHGKEYVTRAVDPKTGEHLKAKKLFHRGFVFDLSEDFPILTTKKMPMSKTHPENGFLFNSEMYWIWVLGSNRVQDLRDLGNNVWNAWEIKEGEWQGTIGPAYGYQARHYRDYKITRNPAPIYTLEGQKPWHPWDVEINHIDQVQNLIDGLIEDPYGRRHIVTFWNVADLPKMGLHPCAFQTIWDVEDGKLNCHLIQRSGDLFLGVPFNVSQYAMLTHMIAHVVGLKPGILAHDITNVHIYENHYAQIDEQLKRKPIDCHPVAWINPDVKDFNEYQLTDIRIDGYESHKPIKGSVAV